MRKAPQWCNRCRVVHKSACPNRGWAQNKDKRKLKTSSTLWKKIRACIFERDGYLCQRCKRKDLLKPVELHGPNHGVCDHVVPVAEGGTDDETNLETICQACCKEKTAEESKRGRGLIIF